MKKTLFLLSLMLLFVLSCGSKNETAAADGGEKPAEG